MMSLKYLFEQEPTLEIMLASLSDADLYNMRLVLDCVKRPKTHKLVAFAAAGNLDKFQLAYCEWVTMFWSDVDEALAHQSRYMVDDAFAAAAAHGHLALVVWMHEHLLVCPDSAMEEATKNGHLEIVKLLHSTRFNIQGVNDGAFYGFDWLGSRGERRVMDNAVRSGSVKLVEWMYCAGYRSSFPMENIAAETGNIDLLEMMTFYCLPINSEAQVIAIRNGNKAVFEYLHRYGYVNHRAYEAAAKMGDLEFMQLLHAMGLKPQSAAIVCAMEAGKVLAAEWLLGVGTAPSPEATVAAAIHGLETLTYALSRGSPWTPEACIAATKAGHDDVIKYALRRKLPFHHAECVRLRVKRRNETA
jgi:hypothetical protein